MKRRPDSRRGSRGANLVELVRFHRHAVPLVKPNGELRRAASHRAPFNPRNDHRMAFAAALGGLRWGGDLEDPACVAKTFPDFWEVWRSMLGC